MVSGELLENNFESYQAKQLERLKKDQEIFGLSLYGDCATIKRMLLMNILASSVNNPTILLEVVNATEKLEDGGKKDASWISLHFCPHLERLGPHGSVIDCLFFDGSSNFVAATNALQVTSGQIYFVHSAEYMVSLFFKEISKMPPVHHIIVSYKRIYKVFRSGTLQAPHALFAAKAKEHNNGRPINLIKSSDTCIVG